MSKVNFSLSGFVIYDRSSGLFSTGGRYVTFSKYPKIFSKLQNVKSHLNSHVFSVFTGPTLRKTFSHFDFSDKYKSADCVVVDLETHEEMFNVNNYLGERVEKKDLDREMRNIKSC